MKINKLFATILFITSTLISACGVSGSKDSSASIEGNWKVDAGFTEIKYMNVNLDSKTIRTYYHRIPYEDAPEGECYYSDHYEFYKLDGNMYQVDNGNEDGKIRMEVDGDKLIIRAEDVGVGNFEMSKTSKNLEKIYICN